MAERSRLTLISSPACKVCTLPTDLLERVHDLRAPGIGSGQRPKSLEDIADDINAELETRGLGTIVLNHSNLSNHFTKHADYTTRSAHDAIREANGGRPTGSGKGKVAQDFERAVDAFREVGGSDLTDTLFQMRIDYEDLFRGLRDDLGELRQQIRDQKKLGKPANIEFVMGIADAMDTLARMGRELRGTVESIKKIGNPRLMLRLFLDMVLKRFSDETVALYIDIQKGLIKTLERELSDKDRDHIMELVRQHTETFAPRAERKYVEYKDQIETIMKGWEK